MIRKCFFQSLVVVAAALFAASALAFDNFAWVQGQTSRGPVEVLITFDVVAPNLKSVPPVRATFASGIGVLARGPGLDAGSQLELRWRTYAKSAQSGAAESLMLHGGGVWEWQEWQAHLFEGRAIEDRRLRIGTEDGVLRRQELEIYVDGEAVLDPVSGKNVFEINLAEAIRIQALNPDFRCADVLRGSRIFTVATWLLD